jgi:hypothetical protein
LRSSQALRLTVDSCGSETFIDFAPTIIALLGFTGGPALNKRHREELAAAGIAPPAGIPAAMIFKDCTVEVTTHHTVIARSGSTSGEVEPVLIRHDGEWFVGVGSDHTDRERQRESNDEAKQESPKIISPKVWRLKDVQGRWGQLQLSSIVIEDGRPQRYQEAALSDFLEVSELIAFVKSHLPAIESESCLVMCGTVPTATGKYVFHRRFEGKLEDREMGKTLHVQYRTVVMPGDGSHRKQAWEFHAANDRPWTALGNGVYQRALSGDPRSGDFTRMLRLEPGADTSSSGPQCHDFWEEIYILEGEQYDVLLGESQPAGSYACRPPGMPHGPWRSEKGCLLFEVRYTRTDGRG